MLLMWCLLFTIAMVIIELRKLFWERLKSLYMTKIIQIAVLLRHNSPAIEFAACAPTLKDQ